ncbi:hypothetical protein SAMN05216588_11617 [Pseudomonas flavescens]|uniref:DUF2946 domain-containing protein n=1 Tax=Phytopseudomonas flavescens TaxID=29435 RepID=A0A1G8K9A7_9GAMM|nr:hypothetical protein [Pseudomonas flavescens]SDI39400.1 hypothetical protein SAMN05216588_11617 [Pseudomonas flavescens]
MSSRPLRVLLLCVLMLALPAQGIAAVGMALAVGGQGHAMHLADEAHSCGTACSHHLAPSEQKAPGHAACSLCVFCVGAVTLSPAIGAASQLPRDRPLAAWQEQFIGYIADTPDRPPRHFIG